MGVISGGNVIAGAAERIRTAVVALTEDTGAGGMLAWQNPEDRPIIVIRLVLDITTEATGAAIANFGPAANATTSNDTLIDGVDIGTAAGVFDNIEDQGTNGTSRAKLDENGGTTDYLTGSAESDPADLVGTAYIWYIVV
jgi:hypothetical protein